MRIDRAHGPCERSHVKVNAIDHLTDRKLLDENRNRGQDNCAALSLVDVDGGVTIIEVVHAKAWVQLVCTKAIKRIYLASESLPEATNHHI